MIMLSVNVFEYTQSLRELVVVLFKNQKTDLLDKIFVVKQVIGNFGIML